MGDPLAMDVQIRLERQRCWECGRWWAYEAWGNGTTGARCPFCAARAIKVAEQAVEKLQRTVAALRGSLTRLRRRRHA